jgi:hypothetical protein
VSRPISVKPDTCTERYDVNPTGISMKVTRITLGGPPVCPVLLTPKGVEMGRWESAEAIVAPDPVVKGRICRERKGGYLSVRPGQLSREGVDDRALGAGSPDGGRNVYRPTGE